MDIYNDVYLCLPTLQTAENNMDSKKAPEQIRIKTLEEIRKEKAAKLQSQSQTDDPPDLASEITITKTITTKASKGIKRAVTIGDASVSKAKTLSEILHSKKRRQEEQQEQIPSPKWAKHSAEKTLGETQSESDTPNNGATEGAEVRVKTLEEIRREKAARNQTQQVHEVENGKSAVEGTSAKKPRLLRINKMASNSKALLNMLSFCFLCCRIECTIIFVMALM